MLLYYLNKTNLNCPSMMAYEYWWVMKLQTHLQPVHSLNNFLKVKKKEHYQTMKTIIIKYKINFTNDTGNSLLLSMYSRQKYKRFSIYINDFKVYFQS